MLTAQLVGESAQGSMLCVEEKKENIAAENRLKITCARAQMPPYTTNENNIIINYYYYYHYYYYY